MKLYQKFLDLTGLVHISEADFNAALDPKTDEQKTLHDFIKWFVGKTDANPDAAAFRKDFNTTHEDHKVDVTDSVLSSPTVPASETVSAAPVASEPVNNTVHTETSPTETSPTETSPTVPTVDSERREDRKADVHDSVSSSLTAPDSNVVTSSETTSTHTVAPKTESATGEPSTLVVK